MNSKLRNLTNKVAICVLSSGEATLETCLSEARLQAAELGIAVYEVKDICPEIAATRAFLQNCPAEYCIQLDADVILLPQALEMMLEFIYPALDEAQNLHSPQRSGLFTFNEEVELALQKWYQHLASVQQHKAFTFACFSLWDEFEQKRIPSLKIWHAAISLEYLKEDVDCDEACVMWQAMNRDGYLLLTEFVNKDYFPVLALHGTYYTNLQVFSKYRDWGRKICFNLEPAKRHMENLKFISQMTSLFIKRGSYQYLLAILAYWQGVQQDFTDNASLSKNNKEEFSDPQSLWFAALPESERKLEVAELQNDENYVLCYERIRLLFNSIDTKNINIQAFNEHLNLQIKALIEKKTAGSMIEILALSVGLHLQLANADEAQQDYLAFKIATLICQKTSAFECDEYLPENPCTSLK